MQQTSGLHRKLISRFSLASQASPHDMEQELIGSSVFVNLAFSTRNSDDTASRTRLRPQNHCCIATSLLPQPLRNTMRSQITLAPKCLIKTHIKRAELRSRQELTPPLSSRSQTAGPILEDSHCMISSKPECHGLPPCHTVQKYLPTFCNKSLPITTSSSLFLQHSKAIATEYAACKQRFCA